MYYGGDGTPRILSIYMHPEARNPHYKQLLYLFSKEVFEKYHDIALDFFQKINQRHHFKSFPIHAEFKRNTCGQLIPIEFNPARFAGMGLSDLALYAFGVNLVEAYFCEQTVDWRQWWKKVVEGEKAHFCWLLAYNPENVDHPFAIPGQATLMKLIPGDCEVLRFEPLDYQKFPAFGIVYLRTNHKEDIHRLRNIEF
jgi:hypothetical protein